MTLSSTILSAFGLPEDAQIRPYGSGLINSTWSVKADNREYILQRVNDSVFKNPGNIAYNIGLIADHLRQHHPEYKFIAPLLCSKEGDILFQNEDGFFRLFPFVQGSYSFDVVQTPEQAYEAARQFGLFTRLLSHFDATRLKVTIPSFHDLGLRYQQFLEALERGNQERISESEALIKALKSHCDIVGEYEHILQNPEFKLRVTHHDTKISNVLFDAEGEGLCVIDLDTIMPGYFISDVGDMMRTYISPVSEEESNYEKIEVREEFYQAIVQGYYGEMKGELTATERQYFFYAAKFMIYMQALRFLTDHFNGDVYYGARYPGHNLIRASNQTVLLQRLMEKEAVLKDNQVTMINCQ